MCKNSSFVTSTCYLPFVRSNILSFVGSSQLLTHVSNLYLISADLIRAAVIVSILVKDPSK